MDLNLKRIITAALEEDIGTGDITTSSIIAPESISKGRFIAKESGVICGLEVAKAVFELLDASVCFESDFTDGDQVEKGDLIATIKGRTASLLTGERTALNFMQRMSGIATRTRELVCELEGTKTRVADTRKTVPGLRLLDKYAVKCGGGTNHRFNLSDGVLIKDNHIAAAGGIAKAVMLAKRNAPHTIKIEVETETLAQVQEALDAGADIIMLDNMSTQLMKDATALIAGRALTEASGNMGDKDLREIAETGVDIISVGGLTHTVKALDISLKF